MRSALIWVVAPGIALLLYALPPTQEGWLNLTATPANWLVDAVLDDARSAPEVLFSFGLYMMTLIVWSICLVGLVLELAVLLGRLVLAFLVRAWRPASG